MNVTAPTRATGPGATGRGCGGHRFISAPARKDGEPSEGSPAPPAEGFPGGCPGTRCGHGHGVLGATVLPLRRPGGAVPTAGDRDARLSGQRWPSTAPLRTPEPPSTSVRLPPVGPHEASGATRGALDLHASSEHSQCSSAPPPLVPRLLPSSLSSQGSVPHALARRHRRVTASRPEHSTFS